MAKRDADLSTEEIIDAVLAHGMEMGDVSDLSVAFLPPKPPDHGCEALLLTDKVVVVCAAVAPTMREAVEKLLEAARYRRYGS